MVLKILFFLTGVLIILTAYNIKIIQVAPTEENTLQQVHVVFRHGDRTPKKERLYPTDPHINDTWFLYGAEELTNLGKEQEYELGKSLRKRYDTFLGDLYLPRIQEARSTSINRAKISLQLVLAGLWPQNKQQRFTDDLPWQSTDYIYTSMEDEILILPYRCNYYNEEYDKVEASDEVQNYLKQNKEKIDYINTHSGLQINTVADLKFLYFVLYTEEHTNRTLPEWTKSIYPEYLEDVAVYSVILKTATNELMKVSAGSLIKKVLLETKEKIKGITPPGEKKIFLYSGHDFNIAHTLRALKTFKSHIPQYSSHIIFELHKISSTYGFKIYYQGTTKGKPELLEIPGCEQFCPVDQFERLMADIIPDSSFKC